MHKANSEMLLHRMQLLLSCLAHLGSCTSVKCSIPRGCRKPSEASLAWARARTLSRMDKVEARMACPPTRSVRPQSGTREHRMVGRVVPNVSSPPPVMLEKPIMLEKRFVYFHNEFVLAVLTPFLLHPTVRCADFVIMRERALRTSPETAVPGARPNCASLYLGQIGSAPLTSLLMMPPRGLRANSKGLFLTLQFGQLLEDCWSQTLSINCMPLNAWPGTPTRCRRGGQHRMPRPCCSLRPVEVQQPRLGSKTTPRHALVAHSQLPAESNTDREPPSLT